ncbi:hypothetical protein D3C73_1273200 [compost metagenome]
MTDHVLVDVHGDMLLAVVDRDRQADELGQDRGTTRPGLDRLLVFARDGRVHLFDQVSIDKRAFLDRT